MDTIVKVTYLREEFNITNVTNKYNYREHEPAVAKRLNLAENVNPLKFIHIE
jgi:hypothetical protein